MDMPSERWVPKVHPATRAVEAEDPMTLNATAVTGDPEVMLRCVVQEYAWMGWDAAEIFALFRDPGYPVLNALLDCYGEEGLRERVWATLGQTGVFHYQTTVCEEPDVEPEVPDLIQLGVLTCRRATAPNAGVVEREGSSHAERL